MCLDSGNSAAFEVSRLHDPLNGEPLTVADQRRIPPASPFGQLLQRHRGVSHRNTGPPKGSPGLDDPSARTNSSHEEGWGREDRLPAPLGHRNRVRPGPRRPARGRQLRVRLSDRGTSGPGRVGHGAVNGGVPRMPRRSTPRSARRLPAGESIYTLDDARIRSIAPDVILAQDLCRVCAVPSGAVEEALGVIGCQAEVVSLDPGGLDEVIGCVGRVGQATGTEARAEALMDELRSRVDAVRRTGARPARPGSSFSSGPIPRSTPATGFPRWSTRPAANRAGGSAGTLGPVALGGDRGAEIDVTVFSPCGFDLAGAVEQAARSWSDPRHQGSAGSSRSMPTPTSPVRTPGGRRGRTAGRTAPSRPRCTHPRRRCRVAARPRTDALTYVTSSFASSFRQSFRATSGPVIRLRSGNVEAMIASEAASPPMTVAQYAIPGMRNAISTWELR